MSEMTRRVAVAIRRSKFERTGRSAAFDDTNISEEELGEAKAAIEAMIDEVGRSGEQALTVEQLLAEKAQLISIASQEMAKLRAEINAMKTAQRRCL